jgi:hypothetical protein
VTTPLRTHSEHPSRADDCRSLPRDGCNQPRRLCRPGLPKLRHELDRIHIETFTAPAGTFRQRSQITKAQRDILAQLKIDPSPKIHQLNPANS